MAINSKHTSKLFNLYFSHYSPNKSYYFFIPSLEFLLHIFFLSLVAPNRLPCIIWLSIHYSHHILTSLLMPFVYMFVDTGYVSVVQAGWELIVIFLSQPHKYWAKSHKSSSSLLSLLIHSRYMTNHYNQFLTSILKSLRLCLSSLFLANYQVWLNIWVYYLRSILQITEYCGGGGGVRQHVSLYIIKTKSQFDFQYSPWSSTLS